MINFRSISFRNFLSTGNTPTEIPLDKDNTTLIIGDNGSGKSTMLDALTFSLFGKPFRNIKKDQLVNSVNERDCKIEVRFDIGKKKFHIIRGIRPNRFEIYCNGKMLNQDASVRDYQKHLENNILKLNYRSFTQVVILGSSTFVPFMQLTAASRREVVEEILDIKIFSLMNFILKQRIKEMKEDQTEISHQFEMVRTKIDISERHLAQAKEKSKASKGALVGKIKTNAEEMLNLNSQVVELETKLEEWQSNILPQHISLKEEIVSHKTIEGKLVDKRNKLSKDMVFYTENDECPTCDQPIDEVFKTETITLLTSQYEETDSASLSIKERISEMHSRNELYAKIEADNREYEVEVAKKKTSSGSIEAYNKELLEQINELETVDAELIEEKTKLKIYKDDLKLIEKRKNKLTEDANYFQISKQLLQDSGIKTKIIKRYLPIMNKLINGYLSALEFPAQFQLDAEFNETLKSRYRDVFSYANFSEGEKTKINLALMFAWRQIAKMKNSTNTNLLIMDEILDGSLDYAGTDEFLRIISTLSNDNIFIISHKSDLSVDKFDGLIKFEKVNNFSKIVS